jgi:hypothetical protein
MAVLFGLISLPAAAEVLDAGSAGFTSLNRALVAAPRAEVYRAFVEDVGEWWNPDHTVSGDARALYIEARPMGCFCETLGPGAGLVHLTVTFINPGVMLRLTGGLGPLGLLGVSGNMTVEFEDAEGGTEVLVEYAVGGYAPDGLEAMAPAVDAVLQEQLLRLGEYLDTGNTESPAGSR